MMGSFLIILELKATQINLSKSEQPTSKMSGRKINFLELQRVIKLFRVANHTDADY